MEMSKKLKRVMELDPMAEGERVLVNVAPEFFKRWTELRHLSQDVMALTSQAKRLHAKRDATATLFWENLKEECELVDQADRSGMSIGIRKDKDGIPVIVSFEEKEDEHPLSGLFRHVGGGL